MIKRASLTQTQYQSISQPTINEAEINLPKGTRLVAVKVANITIAGAIWTRVFLQIADKKAGSIDLINGYIRYDGLVLIGSLTWHGRIRIPTEYPMALVITTINNTGIDSTINLNYILEWEEQ